MIELLFLNKKGDLRELSEIIFNSIGLGYNIKEGDSSNVKGGVYYSISILGMDIKLEYNSYDYDDLYNVMVSIREDIYSSIVVDEIHISRFTEIISSLLAKNLKLKIAHEHSENNLQYFEP